MSEDAAQTTTLPENNPLNTEPTIAGNPMMNVSENANIGVGNIASAPEEVSATGVEGDNPVKSMLDVLKVVEDSSLPSELKLQLANKINTELSQHIEKERQILLQERAEIDSRLKALETGNIAAAGINETTVVQPIEMNNQVPENIQAEIDAVVPDVSAGMTTPPESQPSTTQDTLTSEMPAGLGAAPATDNLVSSTMTGITPEAVAPVASTPDMNGGGQAPMMNGETVDPNIPQVGNSMEDSEGNPAMPSNEVYKMPEAVKAKLVSNQFENAQALITALNIPSGTHDALVQYLTENYDHIKQYDAANGTNLIKNLEKVIDANSVHESMQEAQAIYEEMMKSYTDQPQVTSTV